ncbi:restriction endonuclease [Candidatus Parcubacteria bacterium]|nr:MAG: restriction endonuclease [Candidatus Parcubacteria bacterium]
MFFERHIKKFEDLVTTYEAIRAGFVEMALEKNKMAIPYIAEARALQALAQRAESANDLLGIKEIQPALLTASGVSEKASKHFSESDKREIVKALIENFLEPAGDKFVEELVFRFLLTKGDSLGGSMRNLAGILGERKFSRAVIATLSIYNISFCWLDRKSNKWLPGNGDEVEIENRMRGISWEREGLCRTLLFNLTVPIIKKNVDICLFDASYEAFSNPARKENIVKNKDCYIALGELKAGIDPAGADEHWKTANSALERIRKGFQPKVPYTFFVGAAIEKSMAQEIYNQLKNGHLSNAANFTNNDQLASLSSWLCEL